MTKRKVMEGIISSEKNRFKGYWMENGKQYFTNGILVCELCGDSIDTESFEERLPVNIENIFSEERNHVTMLPKLKELRKIKKENKKPYKPINEVVWYCDIALLINVLEIIGDNAQIAIPDNAKKPALITSGDNRGILLPIYVETEEDKKAREEAAEECRKEDEARRKEYEEKERKEIEKRVEIIRQAEEDVCNNKMVGNADIVTPEGNETTLILYLMKKYNVDIPLRTQGWINNSLSCIEVRNNSYTYRYYNRNSTVFIGYLHELVARIKEAHGCISAEEKERSEENKSALDDIKAVEKAIQPIKFEKVESVRRNKLAEEFFRGYRNKNVLEISEEYKVVLLYRILKALRLDNYSERANNIIVNDNILKEDNKKIQISYNNTYIKAEIVQNEKKVIKFTKGYYNKKDLYVCYEDLSCYDKCFRVADNYAEEITDISYNKSEEAEAAVTILCNYKKNNSTSFDYDVVLCGSNETWKEATALPF